MFVLRGGGRRKTSPQWRRVGIVNPLESEEGDGLFEKKIRIGEIRKNTDSLVLKARGGLILERHRGGVGR